MIHYEYYSRKGMRGKSNLRVIGSAISVLIIITSVFYLLNSCTGKTEGRLIITKCAINKGEPDFLTGESWRYPENASLIMTGLFSSGKKPLVLTADFRSACSPDVSYDGKKILFAGKLTESDHWQIFEMIISSRKYRKVISIDDNCTDPVWLPGGRILFSRAMHNDTTGLSHRLFTCMPDGSDLHQITFHPHADFAPSVFADGRVGFITRQVYPVSKHQIYYIMRPDGTKADKYFDISSGALLLCRARENADGNIFFIESGNRSIDSGSIWSVHGNRPLHTRKSWPGFGGNYRSVFITPRGEMLVSFRPGGSKSFGIFKYDLSGKNKPEPVYVEEESDMIDVVSAEAHPRQKKLPSEVDLGVKTGQIMCQDINVTGPKTSAAQAGGKRFRRIEILGVGVSFGGVDAEEDGSFYLKPLADMPFRIRVIDENGHALTPASGWIWLRPNERRGCVGCHEDPELVPDNRIPMAVKKFPVIIPQHIEKIKEKLIELE